MLTTQPSEVKVQKTPHSRLSEIDFNNLHFGKVFADHMFISDYSDGHWNDSRIEIGRAHV